MLEIRGDDVVIDIGYKSKASSNWTSGRTRVPGIAPPKAGDTVEVLLGNSGE